MVLEIRRPGDANDRSKIVIVGFLQTTITNVGSGCLNYAVGIEQSLPSRNAVRESDFRDDAVLFFGWRIDFIPQSQIQRQRPAGAPLIGEVKAVVVVRVLLLKTSAGNKARRGAGDVKGFLGSGNDATQKRIHLVRRCQIRGADATRKR